MTLKTAETISARLTESKVIHVTDVSQKQGSIDMEGCGYSIDELFAGTEIKTLWRDSDKPLIIETPEPRTEGERVLYGYVRELIFMDMADRSPQEEPPTVREYLALHPWLTATPEVLLQLPEGRTLVDGQFHRYTRRDVEAASSRFEGHPVCGQGMIFNTQAEFLVYVWENIDGQLHEFDALP